MRVSVEQGQREGKSRSKGSEHGMGEHGMGEHGMSENGRQFTPTGMMSIPA